ncbi:MAG: NUDIX hydrolase [Thermoflexales bacterium]|nr:NUDIX hydrolase [Thermoflexales bacterium]
MEEQWPHPYVSVDVIMFTLCEDDGSYNEPTHYNLHILLIKRKHDPYANHWAIPGGFVEIDESIEDAARRELEEETGVRDVYLEQLYTFGAVDRDPRGRVISVAYFALVASMAVRGGSDASEARWWPVRALPPLAFDHSSIVSYALKRLRYKLEYSAVGFQLLPDTFTLTELQQAYETVLGEPLDKRNFRRKILQAQIIEEAGVRREREGRPARLYRFRDDAVAEVKARRLFP